jgi:hypothetical protein
MIRIGPKYPSPHLGGYIYPRFSKGLLGIWELVAVRHENENLSHVSHCLTELSDQVLPFAAGILWEQALGGRRKLLPWV